MSSNCHWLKKALSLFRLTILRFNLCNTRCDWEYSLFRAMIFGFFKDVRFKHQSVLRNENVYCCVFWQPTKYFYGTNNMAKAILKYQVP